MPLFHSIGKYIETYNKAIPLALPEDVAQKRKRTIASKAALPTGARATKLVLYIELELPNRMPARVLYSIARTLLVHRGSAHQIGITDTPIEGYTAERVIYVKNTGHGPSE